MSIPYPRLYQIPYPPLYHMLYELEEQVSLGAKITPEQVRELETIYGLKSRTRRYMWDLLAKYARQLDKDMLGPDVISAVVKHIYKLIAGENDK